MVQIARIRVGDVMPGDVVNRVAEDLRGWFKVDLIEELFDGNLSLSDAERDNTVSGAPLDIVGLQMLQPLGLPMTSVSPSPEALVETVEANRRASDPSADGEAADSGVDVTRDETHGGALEGDVVPDGHVSPDDGAHAEPVAISEQEATAASAAEQTATASTESTEGGGGISMGGAPAKADDNSASEAIDSEQAALKDELERAKRALAERLNS